MSINLLDFSEVVKVFSLEVIFVYFSPYVPPAEGFTCILCEAQLWDVHLRGCSWRASIQDNKCHLTKQTSEATNFSQYWTCCASVQKRENPLWLWVHEQSNVPPAWPQVTACLPQSQQVPPLVAGQTCGHCCICAWSAGKYLNSKIHRKQTGLEEAVS